MSGYIGVTGVVEKYYQRRMMMKVVRTNEKMAYPELRGTVESIRYPAMAEIKLDGEFNYLHIDKTGVSTVNKSGKVRSGWLKWEGTEHTTLIGELYYGAGKAGQLYDLLSHQDSDDLNFRAFDITCYKGTDVVNEDLLTRIELLSEVWPIDPTRYKVVNSLAEMYEYFHWVVSQGYEGIVVKNLDSKLRFGPCGWVKIKYKDQNDYHISMIDPVRERIEVNVVSHIDACTIEKAVGVKVCNKDKSGLSLGDIVTIEHQGILSGGGLRHPVYKGKVVK